MFGRQCAGGPATFKILDPTAILMLTKLALGSNVEPGGLFRSEYSGAIYDLRCKEDMLVAQMSRPMPCCSVLRSTLLPVTNPMLNWGMDGVRDHLGGLGVKRITYMGVDHWNHVPESQTRLPLRYIVLHCIGLY